MSLQPGQHPSDMWGYLLVAGMCVAVRAAPAGAAGRRGGGARAPGRLRAGPLRRLPGAEHLRAGVRRRAAQRPAPVGVRAGGDAGGADVAVAVQPAGSSTVSTWVSTVLATAGGLARRGQPAAAAGPVGGAGGASRRPGARAGGAGPAGRRRGAAAHRPRAARRGRPLDERHRGAGRRGPPRHRHPARGGPSARWRRSRPTSRAALAEMRRLLGVLRQEGEPRRSARPGARAGRPGRAGRRRSGTPGCRSAARSRASRRRCRRASTCRRTGSCRRR